MPFTVGRGTAAFGNETDRTLKIDVDGGVWIKPGAAIAYRGDLAFDGGRRLADADDGRRRPLLERHRRSRGDPEIREAHEARRVAWRDVHDPAGGLDPNRLGDGVRKVRELVAQMHEHRQKRLVQAGFTPEQADEMSRLHTPNFM